MKHGHECGAETPGPHLLLGAIAGLVGTAVMTAVIERLHSRLPISQRYPMPPREVTGAIVGETPSHKRKHVGELAIAAHFGFGAAAGVLLAALNPTGRPLPGVIIGIGVWAGSYFGWIPALRLLKPVSQHPTQRTVVMVAAHVVWGLATAVAMRELIGARHGMFAGGAMVDRDIQ